jgi:hypothetical protein
VVIWSGNGNEDLVESNASLLGSSAVAMVHLEAHLHEVTAMIVIT